MAEDFWGTTLTASDYFNVRIDFWNAEHHAADPVAYPWSNCQTQNRMAGYANHGPSIFPGAAYDVDDPDNPRRINLGFVESALVDNFWDPIAAEAVGGTTDGGREYLFILASDYLEDPTTLYNDGNDFTSADALFVVTPSTRSASLDSQNEFSMFFYVMHPFTAVENYFTFSTADLEMTKSADIAKDRLETINVFPNPYFAHNVAESNFFTSFVTFNNLPEACTIRVFSLSGAQVTTIVHDNGTPFERWYLLNDEQLPVASGMYIIHIETEFGDKILKLGVINREGRYQHL
jgi:hypothetical protein